MRLIEAWSVFNLIQSFGNQKLPISIAFKFNKIILEIEPHHQFYEKRLGQIVEECGLKDKEGRLILTEDKKGYKIQEGKEEQCSVELNELANLEIELSNKITFSFEELEGLGEINLQDMYLLDKFIK